MRINKKFKILSKYGNKYVLHNAPQYLIGYLKRLYEERYGDKGFFYINLTEDELSDINNKWNNFNKKDIVQYIHKTVRRLMVECRLDNVDDYIFTRVIYRYINSNFLGLILDDKLYEYLNSCRLTIASRCIKAKNYHKKGGRC